MSLKSLSCCALGCLVAYCLAATARAENWPQWRGARLDGVSSETGLPTTWSKTENIAWRLPLPGPAGSTPAVWQDRIFLTSAEGQNLVLLCASTRGEELWKQTIAATNQSVRGDEGNYASPSPATDGRHVWTFMGSGELGCFTTDGSPVWQYNVQDKYGKFNIQFGLSSSPVLDEGRLYLQLIHSGGATVVALDALTGNEIWHQKRSSDATAECEHSYASPVIYRDKQQAYLLTHGADYIVAHDLKQGDEIFRCGGLNPKGNYNQTLRLVASPLAVPGIIIVPSAKNGPVLALDPTAKGNISDSNQGHFWTREHNTPDVPSPLIHDDLLYLCREDGTLLCLEGKTGKEVYQKRGHADRHRASPVYADGKIYLTARDGTVTVVKPGARVRDLGAEQDGGVDFLLAGHFGRPDLSAHVQLVLYAVGK